MCDYQQNDYNLVTQIMMRIHESSGIGYRILNQIHESEFLRLRDRANCKKFQYQLPWCRAKVCSLRLLLGLMTDA